jgi:metal-responsive CopG/Arc/MetJ family transcriptional regulator
MRPIPPKTAVQRRKLSVTLDETLLQQVDELATFLGGATDRAYIVEQALRRIIGDHKAFQQWRSQRDHTNA